MKKQKINDEVQKARAHAERFFMADDEIPLSKHIILVVIALFFVSFIIWSSFTALDEVTRGDGKVVPFSEVQILQSLEGGIIEEFMVREGDKVKAGQPLVRLRDVSASSEYESNSQRFLSLKAKVERLKAEADGDDIPVFSEDVQRQVPSTVREEMEVFRANQQSLGSQLVVLEQRLNQREQEIRETNGRISDLRGVISLSKDEREMIAPLVEKGSAPKLELLQLDRNIKQQQSELNSLLSSLPRSKSAVQEAQGRIEELRNAAKATAQNELSTTIIEMNSLKEILTGLADRKVRTEIRSRIDGTVKDIKVTSVGGVLQPGQDLIEIVPAGEQLIVEARVKPSDIAFLHPGQKAVVKITAYDFAIYGGLEGEVVEISADTITNEKDETFYRVRVKTDKTTIVRHGEVYEIIPGMVASVDIITGKKTVMEYIMKPLIKTLTNSMGER